MTMAEKPESAPFPDLDVPRAIMQSGYQDDDTMSVSSKYGDPSSSAFSDDEPVIGAAESRRVMYSRLIMFVVFAVAAAGCGIAAWFYTTGQEQQEFEKSFQGLAEELIKVSQLNVNSNFEGMEAISQAITSYSLGINATWPFVTHPNFGALTETVLERIQARFVAFVPFVQPELRADWEAYSNANQGFIQESKDYYGLNITTYPIVPFIYRLGTNETAPVVYDTVPLEPEFNFHAPVWQLMPILEGFQYSNFQAWQDPVISSVIHDMVRSRQSVMSNGFTSFTYDADNIQGWPEVYYMVPLFDDFGPEANLVGLVDSFGQMRIFDNILSDQGLDGIVAVLSNPCGEDFTWKINGPESEYIGPGYLVEDKFREYGIVENATALRTTSECPATISVYPSQEFRDHFHDSTPAVFTAATVLIFFITAMFFVTYDRLVEKRQGTVLDSAKQSGAIVDSMFPSAVRDRLMENEADRNEADSGGGKRKGVDAFAGKPIADYYPCATVLVADISNFAAWSSVREPSQVFTLLEALFSAFDTIAKKRKIFKVETNADCYVACANCPDPRPDHAVAMARFARDCRVKVHDIVQKLEVYLGPDTSDLRMKFAIHTGPLTAGVLRAERTRFQLFGATMELCHSLDRAGVADEILVSEATASMIKETNYAKWLTKREKVISLKGAGDLQTYFIDYGATSEQKASEGSVFGSVSFKTSNSHQDRLIEWNVDVLSRLLKSIVATRRQEDHQSSHQNTFRLESKFAKSLSKKQLVLDEVKEIIDVRTEEVNDFVCNETGVDLGDKVMGQLRLFVSEIASRYEKNNFHNFEHACHVTQAVTKLLTRVVTPTKIDVNSMSYKQDREAHALHKFTYGITSDPIIQFSCALSALIHDVEHPGVPNAVLVKEKTQHAELYQNKSVAEQNSVDVAWNLLMEPRFVDLRACIYTSQDELTRFRQLVVNSVMATDIVDKELGQARKDRWNKAFSEQVEPGITDQKKIQRKATIVLEHLIQAADVSHMMQHWEVYIKWNELFFRECYQAWLEGRADKDPSEGWYKGEMGFYDFYVIPLAKKLENCGCFGVSSDEFLNYANQNRREWEAEGQAVVAKYLEHFRGSSKQLKGDVFVDEDDDTASCNTCSFSV